MRVLTWQENWDLVGPNSPDVKGQPLYDIPLNQIVIDELHVMLQVMDRLELGLILEVMGWGKLFWDEVNYFDLNMTTVL